MNSPIQLSKLADPFPPTDIEWRIGRSGVKDGKTWATCLAYITSRAIMQRLDDVCGPENWKNEFKEWGTGSPGVLCGISILVPWKDSDGTSMGPSWVTKWDGADQPDTEPVKGGFSNSLKRAAVLWGIGRYLYDLSEVYAQIKTDGRHYQGASVDKKSGQLKTPAFKWDPPNLPKWALPQPPEREKVGV
jgi:hypothetical protein